MNLIGNDWRTHIVLDHFPKFKFAKFPENFQNKNKVFPSKMAANYAGSIPLCVYLCENASTCVEMSRCVSDVSQGGSVCGGT